MTSRTTGSSPTSAPNCSAAVDESEPSCAEGSRAGARGVKSMPSHPLGSYAGHNRQMEINTTDI